MRASKKSGPEALCLTCGLCCDGTIFGDVKLLPGDNAIDPALVSLGLRALGSHSKKSGVASAVNSRLGFLQPCAALDGCQCRIYGSRPGHCRAFECFLFKKALQRRVTRAEALGVIRAARARAQNVRKLLRRLGDEDETAALAARFRRTTERLESIRLDQQAARLYGQLTLAFHDLNLLIQAEFYAERSKSAG